MFGPVALADEPFHVGDAEVDGPWRLGGGAHIDEVIIGLAASELDHDCEGSTRGHRG